MKSYADLLCNRLDAFYGFPGNSIKPKNKRYRMSIFRGTYNERYALCVSVDCGGLRSPASQRITPSYRDIPLITSFNYISWKAVKRII